jgi:DNA-binding transcriptional LysR family regulator
MKIQRLRYFLGAAAEGSLSKAARTHGVAQPALTKQMQLLESEIGARLFERSPRGLTLTETGQYLKDALESPLGEIETALRNARSYSTNIKASLTIGMPQGISTLFGGRLVARLRSELPNIAIRIVEEDSSKLASSLSRRLIDVAVLVSIIPDQRVSRAQVLSERLWLVGGAKAKLAGNEPYPVRKLEKLPLVLPPAPSGLRINLERAAETAGIKISAAVEADSTGLIKQLVRQEDLYTILPERDFREEIGLGSLRGWPLVEPELLQPVLWSVKPDWRHPRAL